MQRLAPAVANQEGKKNCREAAFSLKTSEPKILTKKLGSKPEFLNLEMRGLEPLSKYASQAPLQVY